VTTSNPLIDTFRPFSQFLHQYHQLESVQFIGSV